MFVDDLLAQPIVEIEKILSFMSLPVDRPAIVNSALVFLQELYTELGFTHTARIPQLVNSPQLLQLTSPDAVSAHAHDGKLSVLDEVYLNGIDSSLVTSSLRALENELLISDTLTNWPCKTFRELETRKLSPEKQGQMKMKTADVAPDCSAPYVKCTIKYDLAGG